MDTISIPIARIGFGAAKGVTTSKVQNAVAAGNPSPKGGGAAGGFRPNLLVDLTSNDAGNLDLGDFQMLVITLLAVATYLVTAFHGLGTLKAATDASSVDVDSTILAAFGLGQGAHLTKKAVGLVGES